MHTGDTPFAGGIRCGEHDGLKYNLYLINERTEIRMSEKIPYKIYLEEHEMPKDWYNVRADMKTKRSLAWYFVRSW